MSRKSIWLSLLGGLVLIFLVIQLIPIEKDNPPVVAEPAWDSPQTRELAKAACFDCHSNETEYPWYADVAPMKFLLASDIEEGRSKLNFSEWGSGDYELEELSEVISEGEMPPWYYSLMHSEARLTDDEKDQLIAGLNATVGVMGEGSEENEDADEEEEGGED